MKKSISFKQGIKRKGLYMTKEKRALEIIDRLKKEYPDAECSLEYDPKEAWHWPRPSLRRSRPLCGPAALVKAKPEISAPV